LDNGRKILAAVIVLQAATAAIAGGQEPERGNMVLEGLYKKPGFEFCTETAVMKDGTTLRRNCIEVGGRVYGDVTTYGATQFLNWQSNGIATGGLTPLLYRLRNGADMRSARIHIKGKLADVWRYKVEFDLADYNQNFFSFNVRDNYLKDAYLRFIGLPNMFFTAGQYKIATDSQLLTNQSDINFMERAQAVQAFTPNRRVGVQANIFNEWFALALGIFGSDYRPAINDTSLTFGVADQPLGVSGRVFLQPWNQPGRLLGIGGSVWHQGGFDVDGILDPNSTVQTADNYRIYTNPGIKEYRDGSIVDTGILTSVDHVTVAEAEAVLIYGPLDVEGAYIWDEVRRTGTLTSLDFSGWYVQGGYFITGENRTWDCHNAAFGQKTSNNNEFGALQIAFRYDQIDLNNINGPVINGNSYFGGRQENVTVGLNYYPTDMVRIMVNYIYGTHKAGNGLPKQTFGMAGLRGQIVV
jgi:phosphate-selective porin OprO and OprP